MQVFNVIPAKAGIQHKARLIELLVLKFIAVCFLITGFPLLARNDINVLQE
ncbi:MAG TPA: hypothetical protein LFV92_01045 [Rickettsia endosymbiont of Ceroptres masudai]|nr:hypothetical protein [Rickettsia endosymbiont of Ceroptres masudai]